MCKALFLGAGAGVVDAAKAIDAPAFHACVQAIVDADDSAVLRDQTRGLERLCSDLPPFCRYLFVHSDGDTLIRKASIEAFIELLKGFASTPIETRCFDRSPHCRHFDYYRDAYTATLAAFLENALAQAPC